MAFDAFLNIHGIKGESQDHKHKGEIDILSFNFGVAQGAAHAPASGSGLSALVSGVTGTGGGAGKASVQDFHITKKVDASSPLLFMHCAAGTHFADATFVVRKAGGDQLEYFKIKLSGLLISSVRPHGQAEQNEVFATGSGFKIRGITAATPSLAPGATQSYGDEIPLEDVTLNFSKIELSYQPQDANGKAHGGAVIGGWDVKLNKKV